MVMIRLAKREAEYGGFVAANGPKKKEFISGRTFVYFLFESLLYLLIWGCIFAYIFIKNSFSLPTEHLLLVVITAFVLYIFITLTGHLIVRHFAIKRYNELNKERKEYKKDLRLLAEIIEDEHKKD